MTQANVYQPGVCNIGPAEIRRRRSAGYIGLAVTVVFLVVAFAFGWASPWRLFVVLPAAMSASGFLQARLHFCARFGARGLFNFGALGSEEAVHEAEYRRKDQRKAVLILVLSAAIGIVVALIAVLIP
ncbi:MAG: hypothetical protein WDM88_00705 [Galbitalea sp.]